jgi:hypothetical protein
VAAGLPALAVGILAADTYRRAVRAIELQEERLRADVAALRARRKATDLLEGRDLSPQTLERLPCPAREYAEVERSRADAYEQGHTGQASLWRIRFSEMFAHANRPVVGPQNVGELLTALGIVERCFQEGGYEARNSRHFYEDLLLKSLRTTLLRPGVGAKELREISSALEQVLARRPLPGDLLEGEYLLDRAEVLRVIPTRSDPYWMFPEPPGTREFFSWRILTVKALNQLDDRYRELRLLDSASLLDWEERVKEFGLRIRHEPAYTRSALCSGAAGLLQAERLSLCRWKFAQVATLIALFQAEKAREPSSLAELVPEYLPEPPVNPYNGKPFDYRDGTLRTAPATSGPQIEWVLRR